jgi:hypothetical protein
MKINELSQMYVNQKGQLFLFDVYQSLIGIIVNENNRFVGLHSGIVTTRIKSNLNVKRLFPHFNDLQCEEYLTNILHYQI